MENTSLAHILFPQQYRRKVLAVLFTRAGEWIHLRELERLTGAASVGSLKRVADAYSASVQPPPVDLDKFGLRVDAPAAGG